MLFKEMVPNCLRYAWYYPCMRFTQCIINCDNIIQTAHTSCPAYTCIYNDYIEQMQYIYYKLYNYVARDIRVDAIHTPSIYKGSTKVFQGKYS